MRADLLEVLLCPRCGAGPLRLEARATETLPYRRGPVEEVREGALRCGCGLTLPVEDFVLSYDHLVPEGVKADGRYWGQFYRFALERGIRGHFDLAHGFPPLLQQGVFETTPQPPGERSGPHAFMADHPVIRQARRVLDIGCGAGWSSLYLARRGFDVVAFDPSLEVMRLAKRYAIEAGVGVEYLCAGLGFVRFRDESFDAAFALHCLHHIPDLGARMAEIHRLLRVGGGLAVDDHHQRNDHADRVGAALRQWIDTEIVPRWRAADPRAMEGFPPGGSAHEDVSLGETLRQAQRLFHVRYVDTRYTFLDMLSTAYYLYRERSPDAFAEAERLVGVLLRAWQAAYPDGAEYVTFVAEKGAGPPAYQPLLQERDLDQPVGEVPVGELVDGVVLRQPFTPRRDHLCAVELQLATYGRVNSGEVVFRVREAGGGPERVVLRVAAADVVNNAWRRFEFPPLAGVRGRRLELTLEAPGARPGDAITAWASLRPRPGLGRCLGAAAGGTLAFRTVCALGVDEVRNPQKSALQRAAFLYWQGGTAELWPRVRARLGRLAPRGRRP